MSLPKRLRNRLAKQKAFLATLASGGTVRESQAAAKVSSATVAKWREEDPAFQKVEQEVHDRIDAEMQERQCRELRRAVLDATRGDAQP